MSLRSKKVVIKRPESPNLDKMDFISRLHDSLLLQILSLLPESDATRTRILSNRWKNLWSLLPILHFVMPFCWTFEEANRFHDRVDQTLALRGCMPIKRFYLYCSKYCNYDRVRDCIRNVVKCKVQDLEIRFPDDNFRFKFCWDLFKTCGSLVRLTLRGEFLLSVPDDVDVLFPCLKTVNLVSIKYSCDECFKNLISGCPVLEELYVERQIIGEVDNMESCMVISPSLKKLGLSFALSGRGDFRVVIDAPRLEHLSVVDVMSTRYSLLTKPLSLTEAHLKVRNGVVEAVASLVTCISNVKVLMLNDLALVTFSYIYDFDMPVFPNLTDIFIGLDVFRGWSMLPTFFDKMPNLEHITFLDGFLPFPHAQHTFTMGWNPPVEVPPCLRFKMKKIIIVNRETITPEELKLIKYLLKRANHLEILTINAHKIDPKRREQVLKFYRASKSCRIEFV
ncbi:putative FBD domain, leucine-rich repeat domain superfamily, F-box-like domain superfamily [Helianthus annuus]|uniref:FBD domain, leucine-rich repeat domain superfamily, F-box-like domain superfamily n=1 Tax=Helianthus annuus TaxID=4232 RepID=A0A251VSX5_HELAN|nr:putative FBD domain, leucine-rich repeat domain superfamily, F-box-like domain superfamily [Helianthus annuus]KAJ0612865.1 putative FBD domain, leucine-rich repeat domain superfamily, F-box-like domain superfamily [Helianthus annuus]KAJ0628253.1 putative FBD domain, leucine-rich repeat domain superfamily, F-box-like domain superfamily [Helianthus annuus]KAJ0784539.1 putative FBD domain, leucine-rich repeat domain superfamily, F-box-like domain superfamily [Helianthus annuus]KAJ0949585.1 puta